MVTWTWKSRLKVTAFVFLLWSVAIVPLFLILGPPDGYEADSGFINDMNSGLLHWDANSDVPYSEPDTPLLIYCTGDRLYWDAEIEEIVCVKDAPATSQP